MEVDSLNKMNMSYQVSVSPKPTVGGAVEKSSEGEQQRTAAPAQNGKSVQNGNSAQNGKFVQNGNSVQSGKALEKSSAKEERTSEEMAQFDANKTEEFLSRTIDRANKELLGTHRQFSHDVHEKTGQFIVKLIDSETKEVLKEIPPEKTLDAVAKMWELAGIIVDERK